MNNCLENWMSRGMVGMVDIVGIVVMPEKRQVYLDNWKYGGTG